MRLVVWIATGLAVVALGVWAGRHDGRPDEPAEPLRVGWGGGEKPSCVHHPKDHAVVASLLMKGHAPRADWVAVTVTAFADENTSQSVGSATRKVRVEGTVHQRIEVTIPVTSGPHVDIDGVAACRISATSRDGTRLPLF